MYCMAYDFIKKKHCSYKLKQVQQDALIVSTFKKSFISYNSVFGVDNL